MFRLLLVLASFVSAFFIGLGVWKVLYKQDDYGRVYEESQSSFSDEGAMVKIENEIISSQDVEFEYAILTSDIKEKNDSLTPIPALASDYADNIEALKHKILDTLIERKILYKFILEDKSFSSALTQWQARCQKSWSEKLEEESTKAIIHNERDKLRLKFKICEQVIIEQYLHDHLFANLQTTEQEKQLYYNSHKEEFQHPELVEIRQIMVTDEKIAHSIRRETHAKNFSQQVLKHSVAAEASQNGKLGPFGKGVLPDLFDVAFTMREGEISPVMKSGFGYHIIILDKKLRPAIMTFQAARGKIENILLKSKQEKEYQNLLEKASNTVKVEI